MVGVLVFGSETKLFARFPIRVILLWLLVAGRILLWCKGIPLRVPYLPDPQNTGPTVRARLAVLAEFRRRFPEVELEAFSGISIPGMELESRLMLAIAGGMAPDVFSVNLRMSDTYIQQGFLWPLDEFVAESYPGGREEYLSLAPQALWPVLEREGPAVAHFAAGRHLWYRNGPALTRVFAWRKDLFQNAGLDPDRPPQDWQELYNYARRLTSPDDHVYGISIHSGVTGAWDFMAFMAAAGGSAVAQDADGRWYAAYDTRECAEALDFFIRLTTEPWRDGAQRLQRGYTTLSATTEGAGEMMADTAMEFRYLDEETMGGWLDPATIGIAPIPPRRKGESSRPEINSMVAGIFSGIQDRRNRAGELVKAEEIRRMAWEYIRFLESDDAHQIVADILVAAGSGAAMSPQWMRKFGYPEYLRRFPLEFEQVYNQSIEQGVPEPYGRNCQMIYYALGEPVDAASQLAREGRLPVDEEERISLLQKMMHESAARTTEQMLANLSPEEQARRSHVAVIVAIVILALLCLALWLVWRIMSPKGEGGLASRSHSPQRMWLAWAIMLPALVSILLWVYVPMASGSRILFQDYHFVGQSPWVGLQNLAGVLYDATWWKAVFNTLRYMLLILGLGFFTPIVLAIMLQEVSCGKLLYRTLFYLPGVMSGLCVIYMWRLFYGGGPTGILNQVVQGAYNLANAVAVPVASCFGSSFQGFAFTPIDWLADSRWAMLACVIPSVWASAGPGCLIYLAALKSIPDECYQAAAIDGATFFQKLRYLTFPYLKSLIILNFVGAFIGAAQSGGTILILTFGRANTEVAELRIFKEAYTNLRFGSAIAMAWLLGMFTLFFTLYNLKRLSRMEFKTSGGE